MSPGSADKTGTLLLRSGIEIGETFEAMRASGSVLAATLGDDELPFLSRVLHADRRGDSLVVACSDSKHANSALLARDAVTWCCNHGGEHFEFVAAAPRETLLDGKPAIRFAFPQALLRAQRRAHARYAVPPRVPLACLVEWGPMTFEAKVVDISRKGVGTIVVDPGVRLEPGTRLPRARISHPLRSVIVGLEVRHVRKVVLPDGRPALRAGCRFIGAPRDIGDLVALFVTELHEG